MRVVILLLNYGRGSWEIDTPTRPIEADLLISGERIAALVARDSEIVADVEVEASGLWVLGGPIDLHAHTRVPGYEYKEDFVSSRVPLRSVATDPNRTLEAMGTELFPEVRRDPCEICAAVH